MPSSRRFAIPLPRPLWIFLAASLLVVVGGGLRFGASVSRRLSVIRMLEEHSSMNEMGSGAPFWLRRLVADDVLRACESHSVTGVHLGGEIVTDDDVAALLALPEIEWLALNRTELTDEGMKHLASLLNLKALRVEHTKITDAGLASISRLPRLEVLSLKGTRVTDAGMRHLAGHRKLRLLNLERTRVTDVGIAELKRTLPALSPAR